MNRSVKIAPSVSRDVGGRILLVSKTARIKWRNREYAYALLRNVKRDLYCKATKWALQRRGLVQAKGVSEGEARATKCGTKLCELSGLCLTAFSNTKSSQTHLSSIDYRLSIIEYRVRVRRTGTDGRRMGREFT